MLFSKIKPCKSKYKHLYSETANGSLKQLWFIWCPSFTWITVVILELIHASKADSRRSVFISFQPSSFLLCMLNHSNNRIARSCTGDSSYKFLLYQLSTVVYWTTVAVTDNGVLGYDTGERAWETARTSKEGSRRVNYPNPNTGR